MIQIKPLEAVYREHLETIQVLLSTGTDIETIAYKIWYSLDIDTREYYGGYSVPEQELTKKLKKTLLKVLT